MAAFHPNPNEETEPWIERAAIADQPFRVWHVAVFCTVAFITIVVFVCCCIKLRIPRTKQEIEANYHRKKLVSKFKARINLIKNQDMNSLDMRKTVEIIQEDYNNDYEP